MEQLSSGGGVFARVASPLVNGIKRVVTDIGILTDKQAYKDEIARYESELQQNADFEKEPQPKVDADGREAATS